MPSAAVRSSPRQIARNVLQQPFKKRVPPIGSRWHAEIMAFTSSGATVTITALPQVCSIPFSRMGTFEISTGQMVVVDVVALEGSNPGAVTLQLVSNLELPSETHTATVTFHPNATSVYVESDPSQPAGVRKVTTITRNGRIGSCSYFEHSRSSSSSGTTAAGISYASVASSTHPATSAGPTSRSSTAALVDVSSFKAPPATTTGARGHQQRGGGSGPQGDAVANRAVRLRSLTRHELCNLAKKLGVRFNSSWSSAAIINHVSRISACDAHLN